MNVSEMTCVNFKHLALCNRYKSTSREVYILVMGMGFGVREMSIRIPKFHLVDIYLWQWFLIISESWLTARRW